MFYISKIGEYLKIFTDEEVKDFVVINFNEYFTFTREKLYSKLSEKQNLRKVAESFNIFLSTSDEVEKYVETIQSNSSDKYVHQVTLIQDLNEKLLSLSTEINALKSFVLEQVLVTKKTMQDIQDRPNNKETNTDYVTLLIDQINFLKEENNTKNTIMKILSDNQSYFLKQSEKQEFIFPKIVSQENIKSNTGNLTTSNRFSVLVRENASDLQPPSLTIDLQEQFFTKKETKSLRENTATTNNDKKSDKPNKDLSKRNSDSSRKISSKKEMKDKKFRQSTGVTVILGDAIIKDVKGWELTDESNKTTVKSFRGV